MENTPWERIEAVIYYTRSKSANEFAKRIGLKRSENLYQIKKGKHGISTKLSGIICSHFPEISRGWLITGEGCMLIGPYNPFDPGEINGIKWVYTISV